MSIKSLNIRCLDSYNHIAQPLRMFPKIFDISKLKKGYFPLKFNAPENQD